MHYQTHPEFIPSLHNFYHKNGNYRKAANKVLAAWAKSQNQEIFSESNVFQGFNLTHYGENRIQYCLKYDLYDSSRLVTQQHNNICTFLFVGTHSEVDEWLDRNRNLIKHYYRPEIKKLARSKNKTPILYTKSYLHELQIAIEKLKSELAEYQDCFKHTDLRSNQYDEHSRKAIANQLCIQNTLNFKNQLNSIKQSIQCNNTIKAIEKAESLELFTDFLKLKVTYIHTLKKYLEVSNSLH